LPLPGEDPGISLGLGQARTGLDVGVQRDRDGGEDTDDGDDDPTGAANNYAKAGSWSGTVSQEHGLVVFHATKGAFPCSRR
jgi:hypothetical protein